MTQHYADDWLTVYLGDCREVMAQMEPESVHCVVTSPPYWGLRDYGTASWEGGDPDCDHAFKPDAGATTIRKTQTYQQGHPHRDCRCGAHRVDAQLGLEPTPEEYVANMVAVFREVRRVLRSDGTVWLNLGDSYAGPPVGTFNGGGFKDKSAQAGTRDLSGIEGGSKRTKVVSGLKPKDLVGIPWRVAFALQADGWYLRSDIIWSKPNPMPESVTDRPTKSHEYLFLLSKSARYFYDAEAVREPLVSTPEEYARAGKSVRENHAYGEVAGRPLGPSSFATVPSGRNLRSVWTIATQPYPGAHFATFPRALVEPCIKAGTSEKGVCPECGAPWRRVTETEYVKSPVHGPGSVVGRHYETGANNFDGAGMPRLNKEVTTLGWVRSCAHDTEPLPATVLDPFAGSGTTGMVAQSLSRRAVLIDLNGDYLKQVMDRNRQPPLGLGAA